jgi:hypothetical protein
VQRDVGGPAGPEKPPSPSGVRSSRGSAAGVRSRAGTAAPPPLARYQWCHFEGRISRPDASVGMAGLAAELEVAERVAAAFAERDAVMYLEVFAAAATDADLVAVVDGGFDLGPAPAAACSASCASAATAVTALVGGLAAAEAAFRHSEGAVRSMMSRCVVQFWFARGSFVQSLLADSCWPLRSSIGHCRLIRCQRGCLATNQVRTHTTATTTSCTDWSHSLSVSAFSLVLT